RPHCLRVAGRRRSARERTDRPRARVAAEEPGSGRALGRLVAQQAAGSGVGRRPLHERRRHRLRGAGADEREVIREQICFQQPAGRAAAPDATKNTKNTKSTKTTTKTTTSPSATGGRRSRPACAT